MRLLSRAVAFHDPNGHWSNTTLNLDWYATGADESERVAVRFT